MRVSPFGHLRLLRLHTPHRSFSQCTTSFVGTRCLGIPRTPLLTSFIFDLLCQIIDPEKLSVQCLTLVTRLFIVWYSSVNVRRFHCIFYTFTHSLDSSLPTDTRKLALPSICRLPTISLGDKVSPLETRGLEPLTSALQRRRSPS